MKVSEILDSIFAQYPWYRRLTGGRWILVDSDFKDIKAPQTIYPKWARYIDILKREKSIGYEEYRQEQWSKSLQQLEKYQGEVNQLRQELRESNERANNLAEECDRQIATYRQPYIDLLREKEEIKNKALLLECRAIEAERKVGISENTIADLRSEIARLEDEQAVYKTAFEQEKNEVSRLSFIAEHKTAQLESELRKAQDELNKQSRIGVELQNAIEYLVETGEKRINQLENDLKNAQDELKKAKQYSALI